MSGSAQHRPQSLVRGQDVADELPSDAGLLRMTGIDKSFGRQGVLESIDFDLRPGEVHVLAGENGAGKSTLIKILAGVHQPNGGTIEIDGRRVRPRSPRDAAGMGVAVIHQELSLVPSMSVSDNIFLGRERSSGPWMRFADQRARADRLLRQMGLSIGVDQPVGRLPISVQQMIEIAKALAFDARIIVMDEPTSALSEVEVRRLFVRIADLKARGCGVIYITHKLEEVYALADRITVLRDGRKIITAPTGELPEAMLIHHMVGRELAEQPTTGGHARGDVRLSVGHCTVRAAARGRPPLVDDVSFHVHAGEILGVAGLQGSGASDLLWALFGAHGRRATARIEQDSRPVTLSSPRRAIARGVALLTNDRKATGLVLGMDVAANTTLASLHTVSPGLWLRSRREWAVAADSARALHLRFASLRQPVATLSGGNQQKVALAKWINTKPRVLLLDEPTRGVDVGAKREIYQLMDQWRRARHAIVLITSELPELLLMSDRIMVMHRGRAAAMYDRDDATPERILHAAMGGQGETADG